MNRFAGSAMAMLVVAVASVLAGCQPSSPPTPAPTSPSTSPAPVPTPTYLCTPEAGGEETPCSQLQYEEMKAKDALYAEAEEVYRKLFAENIRISRAGGITEPTEVILTTTTGAALDTVMEAFRDLAKQGSKAQGADPSLSISRAPGIAKKGSVIALRVCVDASGWAFYSGSKVVSEGRPAEERVYFNRFDGLLKATYLEGRWVESCSV